MIKADQVNKNPSEWIKERSSKMTARILESFDEGEKVTEVEVTPEEGSGKAVRIVSFHRRKEHGKWVLLIACFEKVSLKNCPANMFRRHCSHVETAIRKILEENSNESTRS